MYCVVNYVRSPVANAIAFSLTHTLLHNIFTQKQQIYVNSKTYDSYTKSAPLQNIVIKDDGLLAPTLTNVSLHIIGHFHHQTSHLLKVL